MGGGIGSDQMYMCVCVDEHVLRGDPEGEFTACEVSCVCARGRQCSAVCGREEACVCQHSFLSHFRHSIPRRKVEAFGPSRPAQTPAMRMMKDAPTNSCLLERMSALSRHADDVLALYF